jgi:hypothetical protein
MSNPAVGNPPSIVVKIANTVFALGIIFSIVAVGFSGYRMVGLSDTPDSLPFYQLTLLTGVIFAVLFGVGLRLADDSKVNLSLLTLSITVPILVFETYLEFSSPPLQEISAQQGSVLNDRRTKIQVIDDLRTTGIDAYPNVSGSQFIATNGLPTRLSEENIYPLGAIANKTTVYCNESGEWTIFESDEHGFNNPKGLYQKNNVDIILVGDSFAEGACVRPNANIAALLRESGNNVISLGKGGNGSLLEFASFKEYAEPLKPKIVLWIHYSNDLDDLILKGMRSSFLMNYLNDDEFSQGLISRQDEIDDVLKGHINRKYREHKLEIERNTITEEQEREIEEEGKTKDASRGTDNLTKKSTVLRLTEIFKLTEIRRKLGLRPPRPSPPAPADKIFRKIFKKTSDIVSSWDGRLYLVYLHSFERYKTGLEHDVYFRDYVLKISAGLNIPVIDVHKEVFTRHEDPLSLFPGRVARHYNAEGYRLTAEAISKRLKFDGVFQ